MDPLAPLIHALHSEDRLRVWSLVITAFGDLVQHRGGEISTARLGQLLGRVGVEPGTLRTALSRLGRDGWVKSERKGRTSHYRLSGQGLARFAPATTRIYAPPRTGPVSNWTMRLTLTTSGASRVRLCPADEAGKADEAGEAGDCCVVGDLTNISPAYRASLMSAQHRAALAALATDLNALEQDINGALDSAAARLLLIHRWRRIVLRFPEIPAELMPTDSPLLDPRGRVADVYKRISPATETWLDTPNATPNTGSGGMPRLMPKSMPVADSQFAGRFGGMLGSLSGA